MFILVTCWSFYIYYNLKVVIFISNLQFYPIMKKVIAIAELTDLLADFDPENVDALARQRVEE